MVQCPLCKLPISKDDQTALSCNTCRVIYHGMCCNFKASDIAALHEVRKSWDCSGCKLARKVAPHQERRTSLTNSKTEENIAARKVSQSSSHKTDEQVSAILTSVDNLTSEMKQIKLNLNKQGDVNSDNSTTLKKLEEHAERQQNLIEQLIKDNEALRSQIGTLESRLKLLD